MFNQANETFVSNAKLVQDLEQLRRPDVVERVAAIGQAPIV